VAVLRERKNRDATIRYLLSTSVSTCFGHHYAHLQENKHVEPKVDNKYLIVATFWFFSSYFAHDAWSQEPKVAKCYV